MVLCSNCSVPNPEGSERCVGCGAPLSPGQPQTSAAAEKPRFQRTILGFASPLAEADAAAGKPDAVAATPGQPHGATPAAPPQPENAPATPRELEATGPQTPSQASAQRLAQKQTLLGFGPPPAAPMQPPGAPAPEPNFRQTAIGVGPVTSPVMDPRQTAIGMGPLPDAVAAAGDHTGAQRPLAQNTAIGVGPSTLVMGPEAAGPPRGSNIRTVLGVARPGIAPINPGVAKPLPEADTYPASPVQAQPSRPPRLNRDRASDEPLPPPSRSRRKLLAGLLAGGTSLALLLLAVGLWFWLRSAPALVAHVTVDERGLEVLRVGCSECPDGTRLMLDGQQAEFKASQATIQTKKPLRIGDNELAFTLTLPGKSAERVALVVPVQYRVQSDVTGLAATPPVLRAIIEAPPGTRGQIDGKSWQVGANGRFEHALDVTKQLTGAAPSAARLQHKFVYSVATPGRTEERGELAIDLPVTPLVVDAPGSEVVTEKPEFMLTGRATKGATVTVSDRPIAVDSSGRFAQLLNVSTVGETTVHVRGVSPNSAPRLVPIHVRRVPNLVEEATRLSASAISSYDDLLTKLDRVDERVALEGKVAEIRVENHVTTLLLEIVPRCADDPCLVRVIHGAQVAAQKGDRLAIHGRLAGSVAGLREGRNIPDVRAEIVLPAKKR